MNENRILLLSVNAAGVVSLWDTEAQRKGGMTADEVALDLRLTALQQDYLAIATRAAKPNPARLVGLAVNTLRDLREGTLTDEQLLDALASAELNLERALDAL